MSIDHSIQSGLITRSGLRVCTGTVELNKRTVSFAEIFTCRISLPSQSVQRIPSFHLNSACGKMLPKAFEKHRKSACHQEAGCTKVAPSPEADKHQCSTK